jgi:Mrp family chromosome partitioning ATPase
VSLDVELGYPAKSQFDLIRKNVIAALRALPGVGNVSVNVTSKIVAHAVQRGIKLMPNVKNIIAVASGKGGVGNRQRQSISRWRWLPKALQSVFWMRTFMGRHNR